MITLRSPGLDYLGCARSMPWDAALAEAAHIVALFWPDAEQWKLVAPVNGKGLTLFVIP